MKELRKLVASYRRKRWYAWLLVGLSILWQISVFFMPMIIPSAQQGNDLAALVVFVWVLIAWGAGAYGIFSAANDLFKASELPEYLKLPLQELQKQSKLPHDMVDLLEKPEKQELPIRQMWLAGIGLTLILLCLLFVRYHYWHYQGQLWCLDRITGRVWYFDNYSGWQEQRKPLPVSKMFPSSQGEGLKNP
jgi:pheromone shutdown protein TraB